MALALAAASRIWLVGSRSRLSEADGWFVRSGVTDPVSRPAGAIKYVVYAGWVTGVVDTHSCGAGVVSAG